MAGLRDRVLTALDSTPEADWVRVVKVQEDGTVKTLADRDGVPNHPGQIIVLNDRKEAATRLSGVSGPSEPVEPASPGDQPASDEPPRGPGE